MLVPNIIGEDNHNIILQILHVFFFFLLNFTDKPRTFVTTQYNNLYLADTLYFHLWRRASAPFENNNNKFFLLFLFLFLLLFFLFKN